MRYAVDADVLAAGDQVLDLDADRDGIGDEVLDPAAQRADGHGALHVHGLAEGAGLSIVELAEGDPGARHEIGGQPALEEGIAQADLGHESRDAVLAHRVEAVDVEPALEDVGGQLGPDIAVEVSRPARRPSSRGLPSPDSSQTRGCPGSRGARRRRGPARRRQCRRGPPRRTRARSSVRLACGASAHACGGVY